MEPGAPREPGALRERGALKGTGRLEENREPRGKPEPQREPGAPQAQPSLRNVPAPRTFPNNRRVTVNSQCHCHPALQQCPCRCHPARSKPRPLTLHTGTSPNPCCTLARVKRRPFITLLMLGGGSKTPLERLCAGLGSPLSLCQAPE